MNIKQFFVLVGGLLLAITQGLVWLELIGFPQNLLFSIPLSMLIGVGSAYLYLECEAK